MRRCSRVGRRQPRRRAYTIKHTHYIHTTRTTAVDFLMDPLVFRVIRFELFADSAVWSRVLGGGAQISFKIPLYSPLQCAVYIIIFIQDARPRL